MPLNPVPSSRMHRRGTFQLLGRATPWLVLLLGLGGTAWAWRILTVQEQGFQAGRLQGALAQVQEAVDHRIEEQASLLHAGQGLVVGRPRLTEEDWRSFMAHLGPQKVSPGTRMVGFFPRGLLEGKPGVRPLLEPPGTPAGLGPDGQTLLKDPEFWEAASRARDSGALALTGRLRLSDPGEASLALVLPVFQGFSVPPDAGSRRAEFQGLVVCVANSREMFRPMYGTNPVPDLDVELYDHPDCRPEHLLYDRDLCLVNTGRAIAQDPAARRTSLLAGGREWTLVAGFLPHSAASRQDRPRMVALAGGLASLLAFGLTLLLARGRTRLEALSHQLGESEARFRTVAETASCGIFIFSECIEYMNEAGARIAGYPLDEIVGEPLWKLVHPLDRDLVKSRAKARLRGDSVPLRYEFRLLTKEGATRWVDFAAGTVVIEGRVLGLGTAFDVTERVRANQARLQVERRLAEAQKLESLGLLAGGVAHDFNNLLTVIQGNTSMIRDAGGEPEVVQLCLGNIEDTCRRASILIGQMLTYSGRGRIQLRPLDLNALLQEVVHLLEVSLPKDIALVFELDPDLPTIPGDPGQVQQVVMNLVTNAAEAMGSAGGRVVLRTGRRDLVEAELPKLRLAETLQAGPFVYLEVEDTGQGMSRATEARIFDPFFTTKPTGRGLGLAAMQGVVRGHGGGVEIRSNPGVGTAFRVYLPQGPVEAGASEAPADTSAVLQHGLVVVADDEPGIRAFAKRALGLAGFQVLLAADGVDAVEQVREHLDQVRLVALDLTMPQMGGDEALAALRALGYTGPVLRWSGFVHQDGIPDPDSAFLSKPFSGRELVAAVRQLLA